MAFGISILYPTNDQNDVDNALESSPDIVFVHGLNGDPLRSWTHPTTNKLWQRDFLPHDLPKARILNFAYNAQAPFSSSAGGVADHSRALLCELLEHREGKVYRGVGSKRPIIFIGHSLGGLVVKQALIIAQQEANYAKIYQSLRGVIFFGTPHQGSSLASYATLIFRIPTVVAIKPNPKLLETLVEKSDALVHLTNEFKKHHEANPYPIISFYETVVMTGLRTLVVKKESALLTPPGEIPTYEDQIPVSANHRDMCQFASSKDKTYKAVLRSIKRLLGENSGLDIRNEHFIVPSVISHFTGRHDIRKRLAESLIEDPITGAQQIFVLYGMGGSGKTQLCLKFANDYRNYFWGIFFLDASSIETAEQGFFTIARACKQQEDIEAVKEWLSIKKHWLLIIDNADDPSMDVSRFFPTGNNGTILITSRNPDLQKFGSSGYYRVDEMNHEDAVVLLLKTAAIVELEDGVIRQSAESVVSRLNNFALAIVQAGAAIRQNICSLDNFCDLFTKQKKRLLESGGPRSGIEYQHSVLTTWEISVQRIEMMPEEHANFALNLLQTFSFLHFDGIRENLFEKAHTCQIAAGAHGSEILNNSFLMKMMPTSWDSLLWGKAVAILASFSLIAVDHSAQISLHPLVHEWCRDRMPKDQLSIVWETTLKILQTSAKIDSYLATRQQRAALLMHVNASLSPQNGDIWVKDIKLYDRASSVYVFAELYHACGHHAKVTRLLEQYLQFLQSRNIELPRQDDEYFQCQRFVGLNLNAIGQHKASIELHERLLEELKVVGRQARALECMVHLATAYHELEECQRAMDICMKVMEDSKDLPEKTEWALRAEEMIGCCLMSLDKPKQAIKYHKRVLEVRQKELGDHHTLTIHSYELIADCYTMLGRRGKSKAIQKKCVSIIKDNEGEEHPETAHALDILVSCHKLPTKSKLLLAEEALALNRTTFGYNHSRTWMSMASLGGDYATLGRYSKALPLQEEVLRRTEEYMGPDHASTIRARKALKKTQRLMAARKIVHFWLPKKRTSVL